MKIEQFLDGQITEGNKEYFNNTLIADVREVKDVISQKQITKSAITEEDEIPIIELTSQSNPKKGEFTRFCEYNFIQFSLKNSSNI